MFNCVSKIQHVLLQWVLLPGLAIQNIPTFFYRLQCNDCFHDQLAANVLEFIELSAALALMFLVLGGSLLQVLQFF